MLHDDGKLMGITSLGERGQVVIPADIREELNLNKGDRLVVFAKHRHFIGIVKFDEMSVFMRKVLAKLESMK